MAPGPKGQPQLTRNGGGPATSTTPIGGSSTGPKTLPGTAFAAKGLASLSSSVLVGIAIAFALGVGVVVLGAGYRGHRSH